MTRVADSVVSPLCRGVAVHPDRLEWALAHARSQERPSEHADGRGKTADAAPAAPLPCQTIGAALLEAAARDPGRIAYYLFDDADRLTRLSTGELLTRAAGAAHVMRSGGMRPSDAVIIALDTGPDLLAAFFGCALLGAVPVIAEPAVTARRTAAWAARISHLARAAAARYVIVGDSGAEQAMRAAQASGACPAAGILQSAFPSGHDWTGGTPTDPAQLAFIQFTSGSTARAKGVKVSNGAVVANVAALGKAARLQRGDLTVGWLPLHHDMGLVGLVLAPFLHGLPSGLLRPLGFLLRPERWLWAIHHLRGTLSAAPNFAYHLCATRLRDEAITGLDLSSWRIACNGAEPVQASSIRRWQERMGPYGFRPQAMFPVYGMAEAALAVTMPVPYTSPVVDRISRSELATTGRALPATAGVADAIDVVAVGRAIPGYRVRVTDESALDLPPRREGHILVAGPSLTSGYVGEPEDVAAVTADGWLPTGDLGYLADGQLFITGRAKEVIIKAGRNYHPHDLEAVAAAVPGVRARAVVAAGVRDEQSGTHAITLAVETPERDPERLREMRQAIEDAVLCDVGVRPDSVLFVRPGALPKTTSGKLKRSLIAEMIAAGTVPAAGVGGTNVAARAAP